MSLVGMWRIGLTAVTLGAMLAAGGALAGTGEADAASAPLPIAEYVKPAQYSNALLSPDGKLLAVLAPVGGKRNLVVLDAATLKVQQHSSFTELDVTWFDWASPEWLVFSMGRLGSPTGPDSGDGGGLFAVRADGSRTRTLASTVREQVGAGQLHIRSMSYAGRGKGKNEIVVHANLRDAGSPDMYRINLETNERVLLTERHPGRVRQWVTDQENLPRLAVMDDKADEELPENRRVVRVMLRDTMEGEWREIAKFTAETRYRWTPLKFAENNRDLIVSYHGGRDTSALYRFDVAKGEMAEVLAAHPRYDLGLTGDGGAGAHLIGIDGKVAGVRFEDEFVQTAYFDDRLARRQVMLEKSFPGRTVRVQDTNSGLALVSVSSDRAPVVYYLYDEERKSLRELLRSSDVLDERHLVAMRPFLLKTRDGLEIPSYYFLPATYRPGQKLPVVVHIHGGPFARADTWGFMGGFGVMEAQALASRGYAVVLPNFRITPGFGTRIYRAGFGEYGRKMSEDHEDAATWAVAQGFADPKRICISGASYGGAAALWATIKSPDVFACAVAGMAPSDPRVQNTSTQTDYAYNKGAVAHWKRVLGVKGDDWSVADEVAPARHADRSRLPLFIYAGMDDYRVPIEQTRLMVDALKKAGKPPEVVMIKLGEGHGYGKLENKVELYTEMLKFLERHIGVGPTPGTDRPASATADVPASHGAQ
ncbi:alpha/beta fold hydrolase [Roseateles chitinivorans]|uniref:S9 family peptidase n=1 Tax=Roseateles chitinivorans TaxID=2917965 RepID=UPI003D676AEE